MAARHRQLVCDSPIRYMRYTYLGKYKGAKRLQGRFEGII